MSNKEQLGNGSVKEGIKKPLLFHRRRGQRPVFYMSLWGAQSIGPMSDRLEVKVCQASSRQAGLVKMNPINYSVVASSLI